MPNTAEQAIYNRLASAPTFHPASAKLLPTDWTLEPGDVVTVKSGETSYSVPVYSMDLTWNANSQNGTCESATTRIVVESTGGQTREPLSELQRKQFEQDRNAYTNSKAQKQEIDEHWQHVTQVTDKGMSDAFGIIGVSIGQDGMPVKDASGNYVWDDSGTGGEIWGHLNRSAWSTQILNHIKDADGKIISLAEVYTDAYGNVLINAINDQRTGTATINADRILLNGNVTLNGAFEINNNGYLWVKKNAIFGGDVSSNSTVEISGGTVSAYTQEVKSGGVLRIKGSSGYYADLNFLLAGSLITDLQFVEDQSNNGSYILQKKTVYNRNWANAANFNIAATQYFIDGVAAARTQGQADHTATAISSVTLSSSDAGQTVTKYPYVTYSNGDASSSIAMTIDCSAISGGGTHSISIRADERFDSKPDWAVEIFEDTGDYEDLRTKKTGYYAFKVTCGGTEKWYCFHVGDN